MKKRTAARLIGLAIIAVLVIAGVWYTWPRPVEEFPLALQLEECQGVELSFRRHQGEPGPSSSGLEELALTPEDPEFAPLLALFQGRGFRRSPLSLFPRGTWYHATMEGDFQWEASFHFEGVPLGGGNVGSGELLHINNFYGKLEISIAGDSWRCSTAGHDQWLSDVMAVILAAEGRQTENEE